MALLRYSPCHHCTERVLGCHSVCGKYKDYMVRNEAERAKRRQFLFAGNAVTDYRCKVYIERNEGKLRKRKRGMA